MRKFIGASNSGKEKRAVSTRKRFGLAVAMSLISILAVSTAEALDFGSPLVYLEDFVAETAFPTTPEIDVMSGGGLVSQQSAPSPPTFTGTSAHLFATSLGFRHGVYAEVDDAQYSTVESNVGLRTTYSGFNSASPGKAWIVHTLRLTRDDDLEIGGTWIFAIVQIGEIVPGLGSVQIWIGEERFGPNGVPDYFTFEQTQVPLPEGNLIIAGSSFTVDLKLDRSAGTAVASIAIGNGPETATSTLPLIYAQNYSVSSAQQYLQHRFENSDPFELDLDTFQLYAAPHVFEPLFNIDVGTFWGTPRDTYGAAGSPGYWNPLVLGQNPLRDVDGFSTPTTAFLNATSLDHAVVNGDESRDLLADWAEDATGWAVTFADLEHLGAYRAKVYTMADGLAESGDLVANGEPHDTLLGVAVPSLFEGESYAVIDTLALDGKLAITSSPTFAGVPPNTHLAGLQIETTVPLPEPGFASGLGIAIGTFGLIARRRLG